jgi:hypothetical protein
MNVPADRLTHTAAPPTRTDKVRPVRHRRPSGEPPPLPHHVRTSGIGWVMAAVLLVGLAIVTFAGGFAALL